MHSSGFMFFYSVVDDHELLYPLQSGDTPLHLAAREGHTTCVEHLLSTPGIDVNIKNWVSWYSDYDKSGKELSSVTLHIVCWLKTTCVQTFVVSCLKGHKYIYTI